MADNDSERPASKEDLAGYNYDDLQALAADLGYGRIVGETRDDLVQFIVDELGLRDDPAPEQSQQDSAVEAEEQRDSDPQPPELPAGSAEDSEDATEDLQSLDEETDGGTDSVQVDHEGNEKLSPAGFEDESVSSIEPPDGVDLPEDANPDDFEPDADASEQRARGSNAETETQEPADATPDSERDDSGGGGGVLSRLTGGSNGSTETTEDVVQDADDPAERDRRDQLRQRLEQATTGGDPEPAGEEPTSDDSETRETTTTSQGIVMDQDLVADLFGMPFEQAAEATGWEGWRLSETERKANARLIAAYCDERGIDLSTGGMLAMSLMSTVGGRVAGYSRYRKRESDSENSEPVTSDQEPAEHEQREQTEESAVHQRDRAAATTAAEADGGQPGSDSNGVDLNDPSTW